jgi:hypothetical protein
MLYKPTMNAKRATLRLYVAVTSLFASVLELATGILRLASTIVARGTQALEPRSGERSEAPPPAVMATPGEVDKLTAALAGLGYRTPAVRAYVASVRDSTKPLPDLIRDGIAALSN